MIRMHIMTISCPPRLFHGDFAGPRKAFKAENRQTKAETETHCQTDLRRSWGEDQDEAFALHEGREARDAKRHEKEADDLPELEFNFARGSGSCADIKG